jgi:hypothetical protein
MRLFIRAQRRALDRLVRKRARASGVRDPREFLRRMPIRDETPIEPLSRPDPDVIQRLLRWPRLDERARAASEADESDLRLLVGTPTEIHVAIDRVERATGRAIRDVWPSFRRVAFAGVPAEPYRESLRLRCGAGVRIVELIRPAPGISLAVNGRLRADRSAFFEFVPVSGGPAEDGSAMAGGGESLAAGELHSGVDYRVVVTDGAALWRYDGGEVVRFEGPKRLVRVRNRFDAGAFGERMPADVISVDEMKARLVPEYPTATAPRGRYRIDASYDVPPPDLSEEGRRLDVVLQDGCPGYRRLRDAGVLSPPWLQLLPR